MSKRRPLGRLPVEPLARAIELHTRRYTVDATEHAISELAGAVDPDAPKQGQALLRHIVARRRAQVRFGTADKICVAMSSHVDVVYAGELVA